MAGNLYEQGYYETGTASITQGQTVVTGQGTAWSQIVRPADDFGKHVGMPIPIASVDSDTQITLAYPWPGPTQAAAPYRVTFTPYHVAYRQALQEIGQLLSSGNVSALAGLSLAAGDYLRGTGSGAMETVAGGNLDALAALVGAANQVPMFTGPGAMDLTTLGTASGSDVTANSTDETAGRLLKVGDNINFYGLRDFGTYYSPTANRNIDTVPVGDVGRYSTSNPGTFPPGSTNFWIKTQRIFSNDAKVQVAIPYSPTGTPEPVQWMRIASGDGTYGPWRLAYNNGNVLGTVSQSGGVPTGAIIERGSNANGEYVRFADGTLICGRISVSGTSAAWASPFVATPFAVASTSFSDVRITTILGLTNLTVLVQSYTSGGTPSSATGPVIGFGRWF